MSLTIETTAIRIRRELREAEAKADAALKANAQLMQSMLSGRQLEEVEVNIGQRALIRLVRAMQSQVNASSDLFRVHDEMVRVGKELAAIPDEGTPPSGLTSEDLLKVA
jgi:hypothetical protein